MFNKRAETGIGTLIVFIAMILVAAIAASVLIQTATSLQNKALLTGSRTKDQVTTGISVLMVYAEDGSTANSVESFFVKVKLSPGSDAIRLGETLVEIGLSDLASDLSYNSSGNCGDLVNSFDNSTEFAVDYLVSGANNKVGYIKSGDIIKICMVAPRAVSVDEDLLIGISPKLGTPVVVETATPEVINTKRAYIFP